MLELKNVQMITEVVDSIMNLTNAEPKTLHVEEILIANQLLKDVVAHTPLQKNERLSEKYDCTCVYKKRRFTTCPLF